MGEQSTGRFANDPNDERERRWAERVAARRALLELTPGDLRDLDAAAQCECSCHPRPGEDPHQGRTCTCQLTVEERKARTQEWLDGLGQLAQQLWPSHAQHLRELEQAAAELQVQVREQIPAAPWVLTGTVDGVAFYLRERWDEYDIVIASGDDPSVQPWDADPDVPTRTVRSGHADDIYIGSPPDYGKALRFVVATIREHLRRGACAHPARRTDRYCAQCGERLTDPAAPS